MKFEILNFWRELIRGVVFLGIRQINYCKEKKQTQQKYANKKQKKIKEINDRKDNLRREKRNLGQDIKRNLWKKIRKKFQ